MATEKKLYITNTYFSNCTVKINYDCKVPNGIISKNKLFPVSFMQIKNIWNHVGLCQFH